MQRKRTSGEYFIVVPCHPLSFLLFLHKENCYLIIVYNTHLGHSTTDHTDLHHHVTDFVHFWPKGSPSGVS